MDDDVQRLRREAAARPDDEQAARRLDQALARAGERVELARRYRLKFECPLRFEELAATRDPLARDCGKCGETVRHVRTPEELADLVARGACVSVARGLLDGAASALACDGRVHSAAELRRPCVVPTDLRFVDLDATPPTPEALGRLPPPLPHILRFVPVAVDGDVLEIAVGDAIPTRRLDQLAASHGLQLRVVLAAPDAIARALARMAPERQVMGRVAYRNDDPI